jgi:hypothetical protein
MTLKVNQFPLQGIDFGKISEEQLRVIQEIGE